MSDQVCDFIMENLEPNSISLKKASLKTQYATITDVAQGQNYSSGLVSYNNIQLQSNENGCVFDLKNAFVHAQMTYTLTATNAIFLTAANGNPYTTNINAVTKKSDSHFVHNCWSKLGGVDVTNNNGQGFMNLYMNEKKKERNPNLSYLENDLENFYLDNSTSYITDTVGLEANNNGNTASSNYNSAIYKRNNYYFDITASPIVGFVNTASMSQYYYPYFTNATQANPSTLQWNDVLTIPLSQLNDIFDKVPLQMRLNGMELKIQFNGGSAVSYTATCSSAAGSNVATLESETVNMGNGMTFPLMLSSLENQATSALRYTIPNQGQPVTFTLTVQIGWNSNISPTRILIPYYKLSNDALNMLDKQKIYSFPVRHCELDTTITGIAGNSSVVRTLNTHYRSIRKIYIIPFFSNLNKNGAGTNIIYPYQNPRSSCPNTSAPLRLKQFNVSIAGNSIFTQETLNYPVQFYNEEFYRLNVEKWSSGNASENPLKSGAIYRKDFLTCYNVYQVDLDVYENIVEDRELKSVGLNFQLDGNAQYLYDFFILLECEKYYACDAIAGTIQDISLPSKG